MAQTEVIVTKFTADTSELDAALSDATKGLGTTTKAAQAAEQEVGDLGASLGSSAAKFRLVTEQSRRTTQALGDAGKGARDLSSEATRASGPLSKLVSGVKEFAAGARDGFRSVVKEVGGVRGIFSQVGSNIKGSIQGWGTAFKGFKGSIQDLGQSVPGLGQAFSLLTNPITAVGAAVGGLLLNFTRLDSVSDTIDKVKAGFSSFLDSLAGNASLSDTIDGIERAVELAERLDALNRQKILDSVAVTNARAEAALLERQARNRTLSEQERVGFLRQANAELEKASKIDLKNATEEAQVAYDTLVNQIIQQNSGLSEDFKKQLRGLSASSEEAQNIITGISKSGLQVDDKALQAFEDAKNKRKQGETEIALLQERNQNRLDALIEEGTAKRQAELDKQTAAQKAAADKAIAEAQRVARERATLEAGLQDTLAGFQSDALRASLSAEEQRIFDIEKRYDDLIAKVQDAFAKLRALPGADVAALNVQEGQAVGEINAEKNRAVLAEEQRLAGEREKIAIDTQKAITQAVQDQTQNEIDAVREKYAKLLEENDKYIQTKEQRDANEIDLTRRREEEIAQIEKDAADKKNADAIKAEEERVQRQEATIETVKGAAEQAAVILAEAAATGTATAEQASKALVTLTLDTIEKLVLANAAFAQTGAIAQGTATGPPGIGTAAGIVQGIAVSALIKGLFAAIKAQIAGAYYGEESIGGPEAFPGESRDTYLRRVHKGERIVTAERNKQYAEPLHAIHTGDFDQFVEKTYVIPAINAYLSSDTGQRMSTSVMLAKFYDKGIREEQRSTRKAIEEQTRVMSALLGQSGGRQRTTNRRLWS